MVHFCLYEVVVNFTLYEGVVVNFDLYVVVDNFSFREGVVNFTSASGDGVVSCGLYEDVTLEHFPLMHILPCPHLEPSTAGL